MRGHQKLLDSLTGTLLSRNIEARRLVATRLAENATEVFDFLFGRGEESFRALTALPLESSLWQSKSQQEMAQRDVFRLCVATLIEAGAEHLEMVMRCIARLLAVTPEAYC